MRGNLSRRYWVRLLRRGSKEVIELYERIIDLSISVAEGRIDPFDIDVGRFIERLRRIGDIDSAFLDLLMMDVRALHGLVTILEAQSRKLRDRGYGLYLNRLLVRMAADKLGADELINLLASSWRPIMELEYMDRDLLDEAFTYYMNLIDLALRGRITPFFKDIFIDVSPELFREPIDLDSFSEELLSELWEFSGGDFVDYMEFIYMGENPVLRAYVASFLISDGWIDVRIDRLKKKILVRPRRERVEFRNPASIVVVMRSGEG